MPVFYGQATAIIKKNILTTSYVRSLLTAAGMQGFDKSVKKESVANYDKS